MTKTARAEDPARAQSGAVRYDLTINPTARTSHAQILTMVPAGARVLELGPASGATTELLRERGCAVTAVEVDPEAAARASAWAERTLMADLDRDDLREVIGDEAFDIAIAADVLEHVRDPVATLEQIARVLGPEGTCLVSVPNVAHGSVRLALIDGRWQYTDVGLLDRTHLRFFTRSGVEELFDAAGFDIEEIRTVELGITEARVDFDERLLDGPIGAHVSASPDATTFQFVIRATPREPGGRGVRRARTLADEQSRLIRELRLRTRAADETIREQHAALAQQARRLERGRAALAEERRRRQALARRLRVLNRSRAVQAARLLRRLRGLPVPGESRPAWKIIASRLRRTVRSQ